MKELSFFETTASDGTFIGIRGEKELTFPTLKCILKAMEKRGWSIRTDQRILNSYKSLAKDYWEGRKGDLEFKAHRYPAGFEIEFFQNISFKNANGGQYDFDKLKKMPYLLRCQFLVELQHIKKLLIQEGYKESSKPKFNHAKEEVMYRIQDSIHYSEGKELSSYVVEYGNGKDKDGKQIYNGEIKYFRDSKGRLMRGQVYHNINNMWWVVINKFQFKNIASFQLFDTDSYENQIRKIVKRSGRHKPISRIKFNEESTIAMTRECRKIGKEGRMELANLFLEKLYRFGWTSRYFAFELKTSGRLGLLEIESKAWGTHKIHEKPIKLSLYGSSLPMSSSESYWVKALREYVVHSKRTITEWFCNDQNGEGSDAHYWPEVRKLAWEIGVLVEK